MNKLTSELLLSEFNEHLFSSERPIKTLAEDELGRSDFAIAVAKVIIQWTGHDSLVLGVFGPWGSGKSSIKNMILDALSKLNANTITLEFNPWEWAGQEKVFEGFFGELSAKLGKADTSKDAAKTAKIVRMYGAMLSAASSITGRFRWFLVGLLAIAGLIGLAPLLQAPRPFTIFWFLEMLVLIVALALAASGQVTNKIADYFDAKAQATRKSVAELKLELHDLLKGLKTNVLVVVDDVDRLTPEGVRIVFQLVKVNADFPNLVYLLLFQRDTIETTLSRMGDVNGAEFLEKIVQVGFDIPKLSAKKLEESLESTISEIVQGTSADPKFDSQRWAKLFVSAIRPYFRSLRDIKRFTDTLSFHCELYKSGNAFDANPVDLIALEVLRQFEAPLYAKLYGARALLTGVPREPFAPYTGEAKKAAEALLDKVNRLNEAREILGGVFPPFARALVGPEDAEGSSGPPHNAAFRSEWLRDLRPCHPDMFERYFRFSLSAEDLSESQLASVLSAMENRISFAGKLRELSERGLLGAVVAALGARSQLLPIENALTFATGLLDVESELMMEGSKKGRASVPIDIQAVLLIGSVLRQLPRDKRGAILRPALMQTTAMYLPMISFESSDEERKQAVDPLVSDAEAKELQEICVRKIRAAEQSSQLLSHPRLRYILQFWHKWGSSDEVGRWVSTATQTDSGLRFLLTAFTEQMNQIEGGRVASVQYRFALEEFVRYVVPDLIATRVRRLEQSDKEGALACRLFLRAFDRWKATGRAPYPQNLSDWEPLD